MSQTQTVSATPDEAQGSGTRPFIGSFTTSDHKPEPQNDEAPEPTDEATPGEPVKTEPTETPKVTETPVEQPENEEVTTEEAPKETVDYWKQLAKKSGIDAQSEDDIVNYLQRFNSIQEQLPTLQENAKYYESLDPLAKDLDKARKAGIDTDLFLSARSLDPDTISDEDAVWMQYKLQNAQLIKDDPKYAKMKFEREQKAKYGLLGKELDEVEAEENKEEIDFQKRSKQADAITAKRFLREWKQENETIPETQKTPPQEELDQIRDNYFKQADEFIEAIDTLDLSLDEETVFKYGLSDVKETVRQELKNPIDTLKKHGVDLESASIDVEKLGEILMIYHAFDGIAKPFSDFVLEKRNKDTVTSKTKPAPPQTQIGGGLPEKTEKELVADAFDNLWKTRNQRDY